MDLFFLAALVRPAQLLATTIQGLASANGRIPFILQPPTTVFARIIIILHLIARHAHKAAIDSRAMRHVSAFKRANNS